MRAHNWKNGVASKKASLTKNANPLRAGALAAAEINWTAFFDPVESHPDIVLKAVAARSLDKATAQVAKYKLQGVKAYGSYQELVDDSEIDVIYTALPNGLHKAWAIKAMRAGKHVLVEKPIASNAQDVKEMEECATATGKVVLEAMHWRFHPAAHLLKKIVKSGEHGKVHTVESSFYLPQGTLAADDIRFQYELAGGSLMDFCYLISASCYYADLGDDLSVDVDEVTMRKHATDPKIDEAFNSTFTLRSASSQQEVKCTVTGDSAEPKLFGMIPKYWNMAPDCAVGLERADIHFSAFVGPYLNHAIVIKMKDESGNFTGEKKTSSSYQGGDEWGDRGEAWWTTYRYGLEAFVDAVWQADADADAGAGSGLKSTPPGWVSLSESARVMSVIESIYDKAGLPRRVSADV